MQQIHILGTGAMGCLWGSYFPNTTKVTFISRSQPSQPFIYTVSPYGKTVHAHLEGANDTSTIDVLIVATKSFDALDAVKSVRNRLSEQCQILVLQNGMGSQQSIASEFPKLAIYACSSTEGAYKKTFLEVVHAGRGNNIIGALTPTAKPARLSNWLPDDQFEWSDQIDTILWKKLLVNCAINPLTVIHQCQNGQLLESTDALEQMARLCNEMDALTEQLNLNLSNSLDLAVSVCKQTALNYSSMFQDAKHQRKTEIDYITGYMIQQCEQHNIPCPEHQKVYQRIKSLNLGDPSDLG